MKRLLTTLFVALALCGAAAYAANEYSAGPVQKMVTLHQGWTPQIAREMWHKAQGADLMPVAFFRALRNPDGTSFSSNANLKRYGFIDDAVSKENPYGWPIGFVVNDGPKTHGIPEFGVTCTVCHTSYLQYKGTKMLVEGAGGAITIIPFFGNMNRTLIETAADKTRRAAFIKAAVGYGYPKARIDHDLAAMVATLVKQNAIGAPATKYSTPDGPGRVDALSGVVYNLMVKALGVAGNARRAVAPVNFPQVWDIWHLDWVQYNAAVHQPMARNVGEDIGLGAHLNIIDANGNLNPPSTRWKSSVRIRNLFWMETQIEHLKAPVWPTKIFGPIDQAKAARGRILFAQNCARCHGISRIRDGNEWAVHTIPLDQIGTDPNQATGFAKATYDARKIGMSEHQSGAVALADVATKVKYQAYKDAGIPKSEWPKYDGFGRKMKTEAPCGYKARPLIGIWATAPFLHNGTVPSVYDMLSDTRPAHPIIGNPEFDPVKLGQVQKSTPYTLTIDTTLPGNSNAGHWWTNDKTRKGRIGPALTDKQKYEIIEYLKIANYQNYPTVTVSGSFPQPCAGNLHWADGSKLKLTI